MLSELLIFTKLQCEHRSTLKVQFYLWPLREQYFKFSYRAGMYGSVAEHLLSMDKALGSIHNSIHKQRSHICHFPIAQGSFFQILKFKSF